MFNRILLFCWASLIFMFSSASGTKLEYPEGKSSATVFSSSCEDVSGIRLSPSVAAGLTTGPQNNVLSEKGYTMEHKVLKFDCLLQSEPDNVADLLFMVEWYIEDNLVQSFTAKSYAQLKNTDLTEEQWQGITHMGFNVTCKIRVKCKTGRVYGPVFESAPFYAGFKVEKSIVEIKEGESKDIKIWLTVPFGCLRKNDRSDNDCPALDVKFHESKYQRSYLPSATEQCAFRGSLKFFNHNCQLSFQHMNWQDSMTISIKAISDGLYNEQSRISHIRLEASKEFDSDPGFAGASLANIVVIIHDGDKVTIGKQCRSTNDPHMITFDKTYFQNKYIGEQVLYKHNELPMAVHIMVTGCKGAASGTCTCGVAIRNDIAMFIANFCGTIARSDVVSTSNRYIEKVTCDDRYMTIKNKGTRYEVTLPTGSLVTFEYDIRKYIISNVCIKPSILDWGKTSGLCGYFDGNQDNDMKLRDGSTANNKDEFIVDWRITDTSNSLFESSATLQKSYVNLREYCKCNTNVTQGNLDVLCHLTDAMIPCIGSKIDVDSVRSYFTQKKCSMTRKKRYDFYSNILIFKRRDDDVFEKIQITYDDDYLKLPQSVSRTNGWNESSARQTCTDYFDVSKMVDLCKTFVPEFSTYITYAIEDCVDDIINSGGTYFMDSALKDLTTVCVLEAKRFENLTTTYSTSGKRNKSLLDIILDSSCPNNCSGQGICMKEKCECFNDFHGYECNLRRSDAPSLSKERSSDLCKKDKYSCHSYAIIGNYMIPGLLKCKARHFRIYADGRVEVNGSDLVFPGTYINEFSCKCVIPGSRKRRAANPGTVVADGYHISVSNDGVTYSEEITFVSYDSTCYECNSADISCSLIGDYDECLPESIDTLKMIPDPPQDHTTIAVIGTVVGILVCVLILGLIYGIFRITKIRTRCQTGIPYSIVPPTDVTSEADVNSHISIIQKCKTAIENDDKEGLQSIIYLHFQTEETKNRLNILLIAAAKGSTTMCSFLLSQGFPFDTRTVNDEISTILFGYVNSNKESPLSIAVEFKKLENIKVLVSIAKDSDIQVISTQEQEVETILLEEIRKRLEIRFKGESLGVVAGFRKTKGIIVVYKDSMDIDVLEEEDQSFCGRTLMLKNPKIILPSDFIKRASNCILSMEQLEIGERIINDNAKDLWSHHSNLNIITMQAVPDDQGRDREPTCCIVLYCTSKGIVPLGQKEFPKTMKTKCHTHELPVKVEEGFFDYCPSYTTSSSATFHQDLKMGCSISRKNPTFAGTIGPFIEINGLTGFLTCAHVLFDIPSSGQMDYDVQKPGQASQIVQVLQPHEGTFLTNGQSFDKDAHFPCGEVYKAVFNPTLEIGVDAAAVLITKSERNPKEGRFAINDSENYRKIGLKELPVFNSGQCRDPKEISPFTVVIKCGKETHFTHGVVRSYAAQVRRTTFSGTINSTQYDMRNQIEITSVKTGSFFLPGDSGSAVFKVNDDFSLECIGMAIGVTSYDAAIVTPIRAILEVLKVQLKKF